MYVETYLASKRRFNRRLTDLLFIYHKFMAVSKSLNFKHPEKNVRIYSNCLRSSRDHSERFVWLSDFPPLLAKQYQRLAVEMIMNALRRTFQRSKYSRLPITQTLVNSNRSRFPLDFLHTFTVILSSVIQTSL